MSSDDKILRGGLILSGAFLCIAVMCACVKFAPGLPVGMVVLAQSIVGFAFFSSWILRHGTSAVKTSRVWLHIARAVSGVLSQALMFVAIKKMPLMNAVLLGNAAPLFIPIFAWLALREPITRGVWISLLIGFGGVLLILHPSPEIWKEPSALIALSAAVFGAIALVTINRLARTESSNQILLYYFSFSFLATMPLALAHWQPLTIRATVCLFAIGSLMALAQLLFLLAYHYASASRIAPFNYSVVVFSGLIGWLVWKNVPGWPSVCGVVLISVGSILATRLGQTSVSGGHLGWTGHNRGLDSLRHGMPNAPLIASRDQGAAHVRSE